MSVTTIGTSAGKTVTSLAVSVPAGGVPAAALILAAIELSTSANFTSVTDSAGNLYATLSITMSGGQAVVLAYAQNALALSSGNSITLNLAASTGGAAMTAFYASGVATAAALDASGTATGNSVSPAATTSTAVSQAGDLVVGIVGTTGPMADGFTQDSSNGAYATPPVRIGTTGGGANSTIAGGTFVQAAGSGSQSYAPTLGTSRIWGAIVAAFKAAATGESVGEIWVSAQAQGQAQPLFPRWEAVTSP